MILTVKKNKVKELMVAGIGRVCSTVWSGKTYSADGI